MKRFLTVLFVLFLSPLTLASDQEVYEKYGDWEVKLWYSSDGEPYAKAYSVNSDDTELSIVCLKGACGVLVNFQLSCQEKRVYPVLIVTDSMAMNAEATCFKFSEEMYFYELPGQLKNVYSNTRFSVVTATSDNKFKAIHFSLSGSTKAFLRAKAFVNEETPKVNSSQIL